MYHNIEKSRFHKGQYIGYAESKVFTMQRKSIFHKWEARALYGGEIIFARTLKEMSEKLARLAKLRCQTSANPQA